MKWVTFYSETLHIYSSALSADEYQSWISDCDIKFQFLLILQTHIKHILSTATVDKQKAGWFYKAYYIQGKPVEHKAVNKKKFSI